MTLKERIDEDGVGIRWLRTAATTVTSLVAALAMVWTGFVWLVEPRIHEWAELVVEAATVELANDLDRNSAHLDKLDELVVQLEASVAALTEQSQKSTAPSWRFDPVDTRISDGVIGGSVTIKAAGYKLRECGVPIVDLYFVNGDDVFHRFINSSLLSMANRGVALPVRPDRLQVVSYTAVIPPNDNVKPGRANGYIALTYPDRCPSVPPEIAGPIPFRISQ